MARALLGQTLVSELGGSRVAGVIIETEAYLGVHDEASHAWRRRRNRLHAGIYAPAGSWYVYRSYGIHWCVNLTTPTGDDGGAVLIRAVAPTEGIDTIRVRRGNVSDRDLANGPGKVGQAFAITGEHDGMIADSASPLRLLPRVRAVSPRGITVTPRIGISRSADWPLRFLLSTPPPPHLPARSPSRSGFPP